MLVNCVVEICKATIRIFENPKTQRSVFVLVDRKVQLAVSPARILRVCLYDR